MTIINMETFRQSKEIEGRRARRITFRSPQFSDDSGAVKTVNINVDIGDGDVFGVLKLVIEQGGIGEPAQDGKFYFMPWPCACVEIVDL